MTFSPKFYRKLHLFSANGKFYIFFTTFKLLIQTKNSLNVALHSWYLKQIIFKFYVIVYGAAAASPYPPAPPQQQQQYPPYQQQQQQQPYYPPMPQQQQQQPYYGQQQQQQYQPYPQQPQTNVTVTVPVAVNDGKFDAGARYFLLIHWSIK